MTEYELNNLPQTETGKRMLRRVSPVYDNSFFIKNFYDALGTDFDKIRAFFTSLREQSFIDTVDWGIDFQELKYSLDLRPDLPLKDRRARLGIKARKHLPLNPKMLETFILENFGLECYLGEQNPGYIHILLYQPAKKNYTDMIDWLLREKPAHLALESTIRLIDYFGSGGDTEYYDKIYFPGVEIPIPRTSAEKEKFPQIFFGMTEFVSGTVTIEPDNLRDDKILMRAGVAQFIGGEITIQCEQPPALKKLFLKRNRNDQHKKFFDGIRVQRRATPRQRDVASDGRARNFLTTRSDRRARTFTEA